MTFQEFSDFVAANRPQDGRELVIPIAKRLSADVLTPVLAFLALREKNSTCFLLESVENVENLGRYSFIGIKPYCTVKARGTKIHRSSSRDGEDAEFEGNIYEFLQEMLNRYVEVKLPNLPRFTSGAVGFMGYETVHLLEELPPAPHDDLNLSDAIWCFYDTIIAFDHVKQQIILMASAFIHQDTHLQEAYEVAQAQIEELSQQLNDFTRIQVPKSTTFPEAHIFSNTTEERYKEMVEIGKKHIYEGDIFQVVLSQRFHTPYAGDPFALYRKLRQVNPSPYLFYLDFERFQLVGASPEVLVRAENGRAELLPIAGTRPRGKTPEEDAQLAEELLADPKERAEHLMLVDLGRNDLGRVCEFDSVKVEAYAYVEKYSHVQHIVSTVTGKLAQKKGAMELLAACFPAGTVSGSPKVRAMEIIGQLESHKRGVYSGAVGYADFSGNLDSCIAIRTMVVKDNTIYFQAGAGIVADSVPQSEFDETVNKSMAIRTALRT